MKNKFLSLPWKKYFLRLLIVTGVTFLISTLALITPFGQRSFFKVIDFFSSNLTIQQVSGDLYSGLKIDNFNYRGTNQIKFQKAYIKINGKCILNNSFCLEDFTLNNFKFKNPTTEIKLNRFNTKLTKSNKKLIIEPTLVKDLIISITSNSDEEISSSESDKTPEKIEKEWREVEKILSQQLIHLNNITLPFDIKLKEFLVDNFHFQQSPKSYDQFNITTLKLIGETTNKNNIKLSELSIISPILKINAHGNITTNGNYPFNLSLQGSFEELDPNHYLYDVDWTHLFLSQKNTIDAELWGGLNQITNVKVHATGSLPVDIQGSIELTKPQMPYKAKVKAQYIQYPFDFRAKNPYKFKNVEVDGGGDLINYYGKVTGTFINHSEDISVDAFAKGNISSIEIPKFFAKSTKVNAQASLKGDISWRHDLTWHGHLETKNLDVKKYVLTNIPLLDKFNKTNKFNAIVTGVISNNGSYSSKKWFLTSPKIDIHGLASNKPFDLKTTFSLGSNGVDIPKFLLNYFKNNVDLKVKWDKNIYINSQIDAPDLSGLIPNLKANIKGNFYFNKNPNTVESKGDFVAKNIIFNQIKLAKLKLGSNFDYRHQSKVKLNLELENLSIKNIDFNRLNLDIDGLQKDHLIKLNFSGKSLSGNMLLNGNLNSKNSKWQGVLKQANIKSLLGNWVPDKNISSTYLINQEKITISPHCWRANNAEFCFSEPLILGKQGSIVFNLKNMGLSLFNQFIAPQQIDGRLSGSGAIKWKDKMEGNLKLGGNKIKFRQYIGTKALWLLIPSISITSEIKNSNFKNHVFFDLYNHRAKNKLSNFDLNFNINGLSNNKKLSGGLNLNNFSLSIFNDLFKTNEYINGDLTANLKFGGSLTRPELFGNINLKDANTNIKTIPFDVSKAGLNFNFHGNSGNLNGEISSDKSTMSITGDVSWKNLPNYLANLNIKANEFFLNIPMSPSKVELKVSPNITLSTNNEHLNISGTLGIPWANVLIKGLPDTGVSTSSDLVILDGPNKTKPNELLAIAKTGKTLSGFKIISDLKITLGDNINFKAYGLNTALSGELHLTKQRDTLGLYGKINLNKGTFKAYGQNLFIRNGYVGFSGLPTRPILNINAIRNPDEMENSDITAGLYITGYANKPKVKVYTIPATSEEDALSYLLTGRGLDSGDDIGSKGSVGAALLSIGLSQTGNVVGRIGEIFGIKNLNVESTGVGEKSQVAVSGYITNRLRFSYGVGLFTGLAELTLRLRLIPHLYLQTVASVDQAVDLFYQFEI